MADLLERRDDEGASCLSETTVAKLVQDPFSGRSSNDVWAAVLFVLCAVSCLWKSFATLAQSPSWVPTWSVFLSLVAACSLLPLLSTYLVALSPKWFYRGACGFLAAAWIVFAGDIVRRAGRLTTRDGHYPWPLLIPLVLVALLYWGGRSGAVMELQKMASAQALRHKMLFGVNAVAVLISAIFMRVCCPLLNDGLGNAALFIFTALWFWSVTNNVVQMTAAGIAARQYLGFAYTNSVLTDAVCSALCSFGSVCLGALLTTTATIVSWAFQLAAAQGEDDSFVIAIFKAIIRTMAHIFEEFVKRFNRYAVSYVAITGKSYAEAGQRTQQLISEHPERQLAASAMGAYPAIVSSLFMSTVVGLSVGVAAPALMPLAVAVAAPVQFCMGSTVFQGFPSTLFVCTCEDARRIAANDAEVLKAFERVAMEEMAKTKKAQ